MNLDPDEAFYFTEGVHSTSFVSQLLIKPFPLRVLKCDSQVAKFRLPTFYCDLFDGNYLLNLDAEKEIKKYVQREEK